jgi:hypothetical protein
MCMQQARAGLQPTRKGESQVVHVRGRGTSVCRTHDRVHAASAAAPTAVAPVSPADHRWSMTTSRGILRRRQIRWCPDHSPIQSRSRWRAPIYGAHWICNTIRNHQVRHAKRFHAVSTHNYPPRTELSAARRNQWAARSSSRATPCPDSYIFASTNCASGCSRSAASVNHFAAFS